MSWFMYVWIIIATALLVPLLVQFIIFFFVYKSKHNKFSPETKITNKKYALNTFIVTLCMTIISIIVWTALGYINIPWQYSSITNLVPAVVSLLGGYFIFKMLLLKQWTSIEIAKKIADQTIVFFVLVWVLIYFLIWALVVIL